MRRPLRALPRNTRRAPARTDNVRPTLDAEELVSEVVMPALACLGGAALLALILL